MKLSNLSLAILSAIALAACGSSDNDNQTTDPGAGSTPPKQITPPKKITPPKDDEKKDDQQNAAKDKEVVNPTEDKVVDDIDLSDTSTTASQQYIRGKKSNYDNQANPSEPASTTVLSGITLDKQNPQLTNIVLARPQGTNKNGDIVQIAQFAGSSFNTMSSLRGGAVAGDETLQDLNAMNALVSQGSINFSHTTSTDPTTWTITSNSTQGGSFVVDRSASFINDAIIRAKTANNIGGSGKLFYLPIFDDYIAKRDEYISARDNFVKDPTGSDDLGTSYFDTYKSKAAAFYKLNTSSFAMEPADNSSVKNPLNMVNTGGYPVVFSDHKLKAKTDTFYLPKEDFSSYTLVSNATQIKALAKKLESRDAKDVQKVIVSIPGDDILRQFGYGKYIFTQNGKTFADDNQSVLTTKGWGDVYDSINKKVVGVAEDDLVEGGPTHGLVGIWKQDGRYLARGTDDNNIRSTRIFGHYYRDPGAANGELHPEGANSWSGASTIITGWNAITKKVNQYGLAAEPIRLDNVQYGRVTAQIDDLDFNKEAKTNGWSFRRQDTVARDPEHKDDGVDFYFYRGTNATSIKDMASLPDDTKISYQGHALMYGIDNSFHGAGDVLPNAFGVTQSYGLGNFVEATFDVGQKKLSGHIYNAWHSPKSATVVKDNLVDFSGDVVGNTAYGSAELAYDASSPKGIFKGSFFGPKAQELGGSVNSVDNKDVYGSLGWGGVFGAQRVGGKGTGSAWLVSSQTK